jgi:alkanesulfonate monooxygenase
MQLGIGLPSFSGDRHAVPPDRFRRFAREADERGFAGAWLLEHLGDNPNYASSLLDPLSTLAYAAGETATLPVGTSVMLLPLREPVLLAKRAATIQHLASRRLTLGLGTGYVQSEFDAVGVPMAERGPRYREAIELVRRLFTEDRVTFEGEFYAVEDFRLEPDPGQPPRLLAGGDGVDTGDGRQVPTGVLARMDHADGWIAPPRRIDLIESDWADFRDHLDDPGAVDRVALQYLHLAPGVDDREARRQQRRVYDHVIGSGRSVEDRMDHWLSGSVDTVRATLAEYERLGFDQVILHPMTTDPGELDRQLRLFDDLLQSSYP